MTYSQTPQGYTDRLNWFRAYFKMDVANMTRFWKRGYRWTSGWSAVCFRKPLPTKKMFTNFNMCAHDLNSMMAVDRDFGLNYMTWRRSNWTRLSSDMYKLMMYQGGAMEACNLNAKRQPVYGRRERAMVKACAGDATQMFRYLKLTARSCRRENWMNVFMRMSRATSAAERMNRSCNIEP